VNTAEIEAIVNLVVERIWQRLIALGPKRRVLMLFSGASTGYLVGMQTIRMLGQAGHSLTVVMTDSASRVIGEDHVREAGAECILTSKQWVNTPGLVRESDLVLVPTLSMNTAAHLALGLMDSMFTTLVLGARLADKPVVAICDGANPFGKGGNVFSERTESAPELRKKLADNLMTLAGFGIELVGEQDFLRSVVSHLVDEQPLQISAPAAAPDIQFIAGSIVTAAELIRCERGAAVRLQAGARLSPLAIETVGRMGLCLSYEKNEVNQ
jgi:hypothetical protein